MPSNKPAMNQTWKGDWKSRLAARLPALGYGTLQQLLEKNPAISYVRLAEMLGDDVAALQLVWTQFEAAKSQGTIRQAAKDSLAREINGHIKRGWATVRHADFRRAHAFAAWCGPVRDGHPDGERLANNVWDTLISLNPPADWLPGGPDDPFIVQAFDAAWPVT